jgi:uncharacterized cupredoxin-like copper-binding protein
MRRVSAAAALAGLLLAGCASSNSSDASGMMNHSSGYAFSSLSCAAPNVLPGTAVRVTLADAGTMQMMGGTASTGLHMMLRAAPAMVRAGRITVVASNIGWRTHELVILPLPAGAVAGRRSVDAEGRVSEAGSLGEASRSCSAGTGDGISAGTVGWMTVTLQAGHYELVCNLPNHYADGMYEELLVS